MRTLRYGTPSLAAGIFCGSEAFAFSALTGQTMTHGLQRMTKINAKPSYRFSTSVSPFLQDVATHYIDIDDCFAGKVLSVAITRNGAICAGTEQEPFRRDTARRGQPACSETLPSGPIR
jgi:hypothetical protein